MSLVDHNGHHNGHAHTEHSHGHHHGHSHGHGHPKNSVMQAQSDAFGCQLFYFLMKALGVYLLYEYKSPLHGNLYMTLVYGTLMVINSILIVTIGDNPGYAPRGEEE